MKFSIYLNRRVFAMLPHLSGAMTMDAEDPDETANASNYLYQPVSNSKKPLRIIDYHAPPKYSEILAPHQTFSKH